MRTILTVLLLSVSIARVQGEKSVIDSLSSLLLTVKNDSSRLQVLTRMGYAYRLKNADSCISYSRRANQLAFTLNDTVAIARSFNIMGYGYSLKGNFNRSLKNYLEALQFYEQINHPGIGKTLSNIAGIYYKQHEYDKSLVHYQRAMHIHQRYNDRRSISINAYNVGLIYQEINKPDSALTFYRKSLNTYPHNGTETGKAYCYNGIGSAYLDLNQLDSAAWYLAEARKINTQLDNTTILQDNLVNLSKLAEIKSQHLQAIDLLNQAKALNVQSATSAARLQIVKRLARNYGAINNYEQAYEYQLKYQQLNDSIKDAQSTREYNELKTKYELATKDQENKLLNEKQAKQKAKLKQQMIFIISASVIFALVLVGVFLVQIKNNLLNNKNEEIQVFNRELANLYRRINDQNSRLNEQKAELEELNAVKDRMISVISHDFRSPLNTIKGALQILGSPLLKEEEQTKVVNDLVVKVDKTSDFLDNLLQWAKSQMNGVKYIPKKLNLTRIIKEVIEFSHFQASSKNITIYDYLDNEIVVYADEEMVKLVIRNLLSNAIKFSKTGGNVFIHATKKERTILVRVQDEGTGMPEEVRSSLFSNSIISSRGTCNEKGTGLGLLLCKDYISKHGGNIWVESEEGKGSIFHFSLPLSAKQEITRSSPTESTT
jgi:two-component system, sensor histidine kinase and response regulator